MTFLLCVDDVFLTRIEVLFIQCKRENFKIENMARAWWNLCKGCGIMDCESMNVCLRKNLKKLRDFVVDLMNPSDWVVEPTSAWNYRLYLDWMYLGCCVSLNDVDDPTACSTIEAGNATNLWSWLLIYLILCWIVGCWYLFLWEATCCLLDSSMNVNVFFCEKP